MTGEHHVQLRAFPTDFVGAARKESVGVLGDVATRDTISGKVHGSYMAFRDRTATWSRVSIEAVLGARGV